MSLKAAVERHPPALATVDVAVDSQGRALALDPVQKAIRVFVKKQEQRQVTAEQQNGQLPRK